MPRAKKTTRKATKTATKKIRKSTARKAVKKRRSAQKLKKSTSRKVLRESKLKRKSKGNKTSLTKKKAKKTGNDTDSDLNDSESLDGNSDEMEQVQKEEERKYNLLATKYNEEAKSLRTEISNLQKLLMNNDEEIMNMRQQADRTSREYDASIEEKKHTLKECLSDLKLTKENLLRSEEEHTISRRFLENKLKEESSRHLGLKSELTCQLKTVEDKLNQSQVELKKVQISYEATQQDLKETAKNLCISKNKVEMIEAELKRCRQVQTLYDSELMKIHARLAKVLKRLESKSNVLNMLVGEAYVGQSNIKEQQSLMTDNVMQAAHEKMQSDKGKVQDRLYDLISGLEAACNAVGFEKNTQEKEKSNLKLTTKEAESKEKELIRQKEVVENKYSDLEKKHNLTVTKNQELAEEVGKMSSQLKKLESKRKVMGNIIKSGSEGRKQLRKMLDDAKRAKAKVETALKAKESMYSANVEQLKSQLSNLEAKWKANLLKSREECKN